MAKFPIKAGSTSETIDLFIQDSSKSDGSGLTGLVFNSAGLTCYYNFPRGTSTSVTLATLTSTTAAWSSGGFKEIDSTNQPGKYRFDVPNAAIASGNGRYVGMVLRGAANMAPLPLEIELTGWDNQDSVRGGLTALPNAAAEASGGLYTRGSGAGQINQAANGQVDVNAVKVSGTTQTARDLGASVLLSSGTGTGQISLSSGTVTVGTNNDKTGYTASTVSDKTGYSLSQAFPTNFSSFAITGGGAVTVGTNSDKTGYSLTQTFPSNFSSLAITGAGGVSLSSLESPILEAGTAQAGAASTITLRSGASATDNLYRGLMLRIYGGTGTGQARVITGYVGSTKVATVDNSWITNPDATSTYAISGHESPKLDSSQRVTAGTVSDKTGYSLTGVESAVLESGTAQVGGASTITLRSGASATDSLYNGLMLRVYGGTGAGQAKVITGYVGSTKVATVDNDWITMPDATSTYAIIGHEAPGIDATGSVKIQIPLKRNVSQPVFPFTMRDTNGNLASGLTVTAQVTIDGAAFVPATNTPTEIGSGYYFANLDAADLNGTAIGLRFTAAGAQTKDIELFTQL